MMDRSARRRFDERTIKLKVKHCFYNAHPTFLFNSQVRQAQLHRGPGPRGGASRLGRVKIVAERRNTLGSMSRVPRFASNLTITPATTLAMSS